MTEQSTAPAHLAPQFQEPWAEWHLRVGATVVDGLLQAPFLVASYILLAVAQDPVTSYSVQLACALTSLAVSIASMVFSLWNGVFRQGRRGASLGKECFGILVISMHDARPIGAGNTLLRSWAHVLDVLSFGIGFLWPIVDKKRQTFADKVMSTAVLRLPGVRF